eukprot:SAG11_NODE_1958_length_4000_cov_3.769546_2_plen_74_part_00
MAGAGGTAGIGFKGSLKSRRWCGGKMDPARGALVLVALYCDEREWLRWGRVARSGHRPTDCVGVASPDVFDQS